MRVSEGVHVRAFTRPELELKLNGAFTRRLTTLVAAAGYGKSTLLQSWVESAGAHLHRLGPPDRDLPRLAAAVATATAAEPEQVAVAALGPGGQRDDLTRAGVVAGIITDSLASRLRRDFVLVLDDMEAIADAPASVRFIETLVRTAPRRLHIVAGSREVLPFSTARLAESNDVLALDATDLALSLEETVGWLRQGLSEQAVAFAPQLHEACSGWPAAIAAVIDLLAPHDPATWARRISDGPLGSPEELARDELTALPPLTRELLRAATILPVLTEDLAKALGAAEGNLARLTSRGLFLEASGMGYRLTPLTRRILLKHFPISRREAYGIAKPAAQWYVAHGEPARALRAAIDADHLDLIDELIRSHGLSLIDHPDDLLIALDRLPEAVRDAPEMVVLGAFAQQNRGDWTQARALLAKAAKGPAFDSAVAWRLAQIDYLRGDLASAEAMCERGLEFARPADGAAMCAAIYSSVRWARGDRDGCAEYADQALDQAAATGNSRALAMAHTSLAMLAAFDGDRRANEAHYARAMEHAERAGDVLQQIRLRSNRGVHFLKEGAYPAALAEFDAGDRMAALKTFAPLGALIKTNRAEVLIRLGRLEEAAADAAAAVASWAALGSRLIGFGLNRLAQIQALRGDRAAAQASYREAIAEASDSGEVQGKATALAGLAELLALDDPAEAQLLVKQEMTYRSGTAAVKTKVAAARVALAAGDLNDARELLEDATEEVNTRHDRVGRAHVTELRARIESSLDIAQESIEVWAALQDPVGQARAELIRAGLIRAQLGDSGQAAEIALSVRKRMREIGCRSLDLEIESLLGPSTSAGAPIFVQTLGTFRVIRDGVPVPRGAWQSRKARDLLKLLLTRRGTPMPREQAAEILWPESESADPGTTLKRLNVMISTLRGVLDPTRRYPPAHYLVSESGALRLDHEHLTADVDTFLNLAAEAQRLDTAEHWRAVEAAYTGEFCADDPYADWATPLRDQVRLAYLQAAAKVAEAEAEAGQYEQAARLWLRLLELDPYHERAHLSLVQVMQRAGWRADARKRYHAYTDMMRELNLEPSPYPAAETVP
jgi:ATP/maltotriose-dependent transcriptional regulator MalT/DNA-binding SARP family transcriptional activator